MKFSAESELSNFFATYPLYKKFLFAEFLGTGPFDHIQSGNFNNRAFKFHCPSEQENQTFRTKNVSDEPIGRLFSGQRDSNFIPNNFDSKTRKLDLILHLKGCCQSCGFCMDFLIKATSDKTWDDKESGMKFYIQKIGQYPAFEISIDSDIKNYILTEDQSFYQKALTCLSVNFGIGSFAYFRRIIENEIKRIIYDISEIDFEGRQSIKKALAQYEIDHQMSKLIDSINSHLPKSFESLGDNPIRLLYDQLSQGIHRDSDDDCSTKAEQIDIILKYVIRKLNEEKYQISEVKSALKTLRKTNNA